MIKTVELVRFRGFERLKAELAAQTFIVGPNSAGKSTVLEAIGFAEQCLKVARRKTPTTVLTYGGQRLRVFPLPTSIDNAEDPVRFDFGTQETRVTVQWSNDAQVHIIWPDDEDDSHSPFFYLDDGDGTQPTTVSMTRTLFSSVEVLPVVTPLDHKEELKSAIYVEANSNTRLASRHFRNQALLMLHKNEWDPFKVFCRTWMPEIELLDVSLVVGVNRLAVFYSEPYSRVPKELAWAGDGVQIWVQLLWHIFRIRSAGTIVLDEPEVYLHPDLQRRLVRLLDSLSVQVIMASHSAEVIAEAPREGILWVDRRAGGARRAKSQQSIANLSASLGSSYNLTLARSMRSRLVVASDCEDPRVIRQLAKQIGASNLANEQLVSIVQMREAAYWSSNSNLGESLREVLPPKLPAVVLLQAGHRSAGFNAQLEKNLSASSISATILKRTEFDNYLLDPDTVARVAGAARETVAVRISEACEQLRDSTRAEFVTARLTEAKQDNLSAALNQAELDFDLAWQDYGQRIALVRGSEILKRLNIWLEGEGYRPISCFSLAKAIKPQALHTELFKILHQIDEMVD